MARKDSPDDPQPLAGKEAVSRANRSLDAALRPPKLDDFVGQQFPPAQWDLDALDAIGRALSGTAIPDLALDASGNRDAILINHLKFSIQRRQPSERRRGFFG